MERFFDVVIIGGGILGTSLSYFVSSLRCAKSVAVIEQEARVAEHTSRRNTGKIHAPYLYDPRRKGLFARASFYGYDMWREYSHMHGAPFRRDGVVEVAVDDGDEAALERYMRWGVENGLEAGRDITVVSGTELRRTEPEVSSRAALVVHKEASADYGRLTECLMDDSATAGTTFLLNRRALDVQQTGDGWRILAAPPAPGRVSGTGRRHRRPDADADVIRCRFLINAAGGESVDIAHGLGLAVDLTDVHFRGEYWQAPAEYARLTRTSIYSVPEFPEYPFLDPHWIVRVDGRCEIGPNAVPVFSPYGYDHAENIRELLPKTIELLGSGALKTILDRQFQSLAIGEIRSSISKSAMVNRVRRFLPRINSDHIKKRGTAGIRSSVIDSNGKFVPDVVMIKGDGPSLHILNYNSPGATGVLPFSLHVMGILHRDGLLDVPDTGARCGPWQAALIERLLYDK